MSIAELLLNKIKPWLNIRVYNLVADGIITITGALTASSLTLTSTSANQITLPNQCYISQENTGPGTDTSTLILKGRGSVFINVDNNFDDSSSVFRVTKNTGTSTLMEQNQDGKLTLVCTNGTGRIVLQDVAGNACTFVVAQSLGINFEITFPSQSGTLATLALTENLSNKTFTNTTNFSATTNQVRFGTTNTTTINSIAPAASRTYSIEDQGGAASFLLGGGLGSSGYTQGTSINTDVNVTTRIGKITMFAAIGATTAGNFKILTSFITTTSQVLVWVTGTQSLVNFDVPLVTTSAQGAGTITVNVANNDVNALSNAPVICYMIV